MIPASFEYSVTNWPVSAGTKASGRAAGRKKEKKGEREREKKKERSSLHRQKDIHYKRVYNNALAGMTKPGTQKIPLLLGQ
jgi:hypothetical protein